MSLAEQVRLIASSVVTLEAALATRTAEVQSLSTQVAALSADNAALRKRLDALPVESPIESPDGDDPTPAALQWGFAANETDSAAGLRVAIPRIKADGGNWLRLWHTGFGVVSSATAGLVQAAADAGVNVILCVQPKDGESRNLDTPDFAAFVSRNAGVLKKLAFVEAGNELNLVQYRPDDLGGNNTWHANYVRRWLKPMYDALRTIGVKTMCTSITDTQKPENYVPQYAALLTAGAADCCDAVAMHPYVMPQHLQVLSTAITTLRETWKKPVHITEANVMTRGLTKEQWPAQFRSYVSTLRTAGVASIAFYRGLPKTTGKWSWPTLFDANGKPTECYATLLTAMRE